MPKPGFKVLLIYLAVLSVLPMAAIERNASLPVRVQLIANGGCEEPLLAGNIPLWTEVTGTNWTQRSSNPLPWEGGNYFFPGVAASAELHQDVDLTDYAALIDAGGAAFRFTQENTVGVQHRFFSMQHRGNAAEDDFLPPAAVFIRYLPAALDLCRDHDRNTHQVNRVVITEWLQVVIDEIHGDIFR